MLRSPRPTLPLALEVLLACAAAPAGAWAQEDPGSAAVTTPAEHLGRPVGVDFELADWGEVSGYFERLGAESPRVLVRTIGRTTEGRDFLLATISSEANLARLDEIRELCHRVADPRGASAAEKQRILRDGRVVLFVSCAMHATETAAPQFAMELAHRLATSEDEPWAAAREEVVVHLFPSLNPDGQDHVVSWYRETVGTPFEATALLKLYQYYSGHDNNRDWFGLTQDETRLVTEQLYSVWRPQVYWDVHQQGRSRERFFVPPFRDPLNPNLDAGVIAGIGTLGTRALYDMTAEGKSGVSTGVTYDMWWNGGNRNVPVRHNVIGILTEAASVRIASPVFLEPASLEAPRGIPEYAPSNRFPEPWPGGWWRLRDIIDYELAFARSLLASLAREPETWLEGAMAAAERAIGRGRREGPRAWLVPSDNRDRAAVRRLVDGLLLGGVEIGAARAPFTADGRSWPAGTLVISMDQPYGTHVRDLFEVQRYPAGDPPYDVAGWTLPLLFGVRRVAVMGEFEADLAAVERPEDALAGFPELPGPELDARDGDAWRAAFDAVSEGEPVALGVGPKAGRLRLGEAGEDERWRALRSPVRIGVYAPWSGSKDEGWMRWVLDTFGVPYVRVRNEMLRAGALADFLDVLVLPSISPGYLDRGRAPGTVHPEYARGLDPEGAVAVEEFVRGGGTLVTTASSSRWAIELFGLPLLDVTRGEEAGRFSCPGSVLRGVPTGDPLAGGLPRSVALFFSRSAAWRVTEGSEEGSGSSEGGGTARPGAAGEHVGELDVLLRYAPTRALLSGWIRAPEVIAGQAAWVRAAYGEGRVHLFGFRPQYRGWAQGTFPLLFRAFLWSE